jgi:hypothetical protein
MIFIIITIIIIFVLIAVTVPCVLIQKKKEQNNGLIEFASWSGLMNQYIHFIESIKKMKQNNITSAFVDEVIIDINGIETQPASNLYDLEKIGNHYGIKLKDVEQNKKEKLTKYPIESMNFENLKEPLYFNKKIIETIDKQKINKNEKWVVLHLKTGVDSIKHYSQIHKITQKEFEFHLRKYYLDILEEFSDPDYCFYVCCSNKLDPIILFLKKTHKVISSDKIPNCREENAIRDMMTVKLYFENAHAAILPINFSTKTGSSFSSWLYQHCNFKQTYFIDQDDTFWI